MIKMINMVKGFFQPKKYQIGDYQLILYLIMASKNTNYNELRNFLIEEGLSGEEARLEIAVLIMNSETT